MQIMKLYMYTFIHVTKKYRQVAMNPHLTFHCFLERTSLFSMKVGKKLSIQTMAKYDI